MDKYISLDDLQKAAKFIRMEDGKMALAVLYKDIVDASVTVPIYDLCEKHENCTVEVWKNSVTGELSIGWHENKGEDE